MMFNLKTNNYKITKNNLKMNLNNFKFNLKTMNKITNKLLKINKFH